MRASRPAHPEQRNLPRSTFLHRLRAGASSGTAFRLLPILAFVVFLTVSMHGGELVRRWSSPLGASLYPEFPTLASPLIVNPGSNEVLINANRYVRISLSGNATDQPALDGTLIGVDTQGRLVTYKILGPRYHQFSTNKLSIQRFLQDGTPSGALRVIPFPTGFTGSLEAALDFQSNLILLTQSTNTTHSYVLSKVNPAGDLLWSLEEPWNDPSHPEQATPAGSVLFRLDPTGSIFVGATFQDSANESTYPVTAKVSPDGNVLWSRSYRELLSTNALSGRLVEMAPTPDGKLAVLIEEVLARTLAPNTVPVKVTGLVTTKLSTTGNPDWTEHFSSTEGYCDAGALTVDIQGNAIVAGILNTPHNSDPPGPILLIDAQLLLRKYSAEGVLRWSGIVRPEAPTLQICNLAVGSDGNIFVLGALRERRSYSFQAFAYASTGTLRWSRTLPGAAGDQLVGSPPRDPLSARIAVRPGGEILVKSIQGDRASRWPDAITRLSETGNIEWTRLVSHSPEETQLPSMVAADPQHNSYWFSPSSTQASGWDCQAYDDQGTRLWTSGLETSGALPGPLTDVVSSKVGLVHVLQVIPPQNTNEGIYFRYVAPGFRLTALGNDGTVSWSTTEWDPTLREGTGFTLTRLPLSLAVDARGSSYVLSHINEQTLAPDSARFEIHAYTPSGSLVYSNRVPAYAEGQGTNAHYGIPKSIAVDPSGNLLVAGIDAFFVSLESDVHVEGKYGSLLLRYSPEGKLLWKQRLTLPSLPGEPSGHNANTTIQVTVDSQGSAYLTSERPNGDVVTSKFSSSGDQLWTSTGRWVDLPLSSRDEQKRWMTDARGAQRFIIDHPEDRLRLKSENRLRDLDLRREQQLEQTAHPNGGLFTRTIWWFGSGDVVTMADAFSTIGPISAWTYSLQWLTDRPRVSLHEGQAIFEALLNPETSYLIQQASTPFGPWLPATTATADWIGDIRVTLDLPNSRAAFFRASPTTELR
jgi:hypothetical protein